MQRQHVKAHRISGFKLPPEDGQPRTLRVDIDPYAMADRIEASPVSG